MNIACALAKLGNPVEFIGAVGADHWGDALLTLLDDMHVGRRCVQRRHKAPTRQVYLTKNETGNDQRNAEQTSFAFAGFSESDPAIFADAHLFANALEADFFVKADFLLIGTLSLAYPDTREAVEHALSIASAHNVPILVDVNWRPMFWSKPAEAPGRIYDLLRKVQFLKISESEADWLFGTLSARAIAHQFPQLKGVLITAGDQVSGGNGVHYCFRQVIGHVPSFEVDVEDVAGASDAFTAGFVHQLLKQGTLCLDDETKANEVVRYASAMGALATTRPGAIAALPTANEVEVFLYLN